MTPDPVVQGAPAHLVRGEVEVVANGFTYAEGPVWNPGAGALLFHDIPGDTRYVWTPGDGLAVDQHPSQKGNGMAVDPQGRLLVCEQALHRVVRHEPDGSVTVLAAEYDGRALNSPNDLAIHASGDVYFSDPAYGRIPVYGVASDQELDFQGVYRVRADDGALELVANDQIQPNGLCFSPDGTRFYVNDCEVGDIWIYDVADDGTIGDGRIFRAQAGVACPWDDVIADRLPSGYVDGMKCDEHGNVYVTSVGGLLVLDPGGTPLGLIALPEDVANFTWGGDDGLDLFVCCRTFVGRVPMRARAAYRGPAS